MTLFFVVLSLALGSSAWSVPPGPAARCEGLATQPSIDAVLAVDPENEVEILAFMNAVVPLPKRADDKNEALRDAFVTFWTIYQPELGKGVIEDRVRHIDFAKLGLTRLRGSANAEKRQEVGRLRLAWLTFRASVAPDAPTDPAVLHRARVMSMSRRHIDILGYMRQTADPFVNLDNDSSMNVLRGYYETHLPGQPIPELKLNGAGTRARAKELTAQWGEYVDAVTSMIDVSTPAPAFNPGFKLQTNPDPSADPADVPADARAILEYLVVRYPKIVAKEKRSLIFYFKALRADYELGDSRVDIGENAFQTMGDSRSKVARLEIEEAWREFTKDRARKGHDRRPANDGARTPRTSE